MGEFAETLEATRKLIGAKSASLLAVVASTASLQLVAGASAAASAAGRRDQILQAVLSQGSSKGHGRPRVLWLPDANGVPASAALASLAHQGGRDLFLLLEGMGANGAGRARWTGRIEDAAILVRARIDAESQVLQERAKSTAATLALDHAECGVIAVNADHEVMLTNAAADSILAEENGLHLRRGLIRPTDRADSVRFQTALDTVIAPPGADRTAERALLILLTRRGGARPLIAVIAPVAHASAGSEVDAAALVYVLRPDRSGSRGLDALCQLHGLSPAETRLITHLYTGLTLTEAAAEMRIKTETARAYLKQAFAKMGAHRQSDLLSLLGRYMRAIRGNYDYKPA